MPLNAHDGGFSAMLCPKAALNIRFRLRFAPRLTKKSLKA
jgi:hypothetical protein